MLDGQLLGPASWGLEDSEKQAGCTMSGPLSDHIFGQLPSLSGLNSHRAGQAGRLGEMEGSLPVSSWILATLLTSMTLFFFFCFLGLHKDG